MSFQKYLDAVDQILEEPKPDVAGSTLATLKESWISTKLNMKSPIDGIMVPGWNIFNRATRGIRPNEFTILCGPTGCGKTTLLANMATLLAGADVPIFIGSVETGKDDFTRVMAGILANQDPYEAFNEQTLKYLEQDHGKILKSLQHQTVRYDSRVPHRQLLADLLYSIETFGTKVALMDNLNFLMEVTSSKDQLVAMDKAVHDFTVFVKKNPVHVVMVMHPKKTEGGRVESEFDIKGSSTSVQEASNVILWNRLAQESDAVQDAPSQYCREMKFAKVRKNGRAAGARIIYSIDKKSPRLMEEKLL